MMIAKRFLYLDALVKEVSCRETCVRRRCCFLWVSFYEGSDKAIRESKENHERHLEREKNDDEAILIWSWRVKKLCKWTNNTDLKVPLSSAWIQISQTEKAKNCGAKSLFKIVLPLKQSGVVGQTHRFITLSLSRDFSTREFSWSFWPEICLFDEWSLSSPSLDFCKKTQQKVIFSISSLIVV